MSPVTASSKNPESFPLRRGGEPIIAADEVEPLRIFGRGGQRRRQLQRICRPQRMKPKQSDRAVAYLLQRLDLQPTRRQPPKLLKGPIEFADFETAIPPEAVQGGCALHSTSPPRHNGWIAPDRRATLGAAGFLHDKRHQCRGIPVFHRSSRRSATIRSPALAPAVSRTRGAFRKRSTSRGVRGGAATPRRTSSAAPWSAPRSSPRQGSIRATGFPRCVINTASPRRTSPSSPLRAFFASLTLARLMWLF